MGSRVEQVGPWGWAAALSQSCRVADFFCLVLRCGFTGTGLACEPPSAPAEGDVSRAVAALFHQWLVKLSAGSRVDAGPAVLAVVLQASDVGTEEGGELPPAASPLALVTHLVVQDVRLHLHLGEGRRGRGRI